MYEIKHHQVIESALKNFNADFFYSNNILFGGGTRIALEIDEYRESIDIDFLCPTRASYKAVREQVTNISLGQLVHEDFDYAREIRADRDGVRTIIQLGDTSIKLEFVSFNEYQLTASEADINVFPVPCISIESCFVTKLLANADRSLNYPFKDIFDILAMYSKWGTIPEDALKIAHDFYGDVAVRELKNALAHMIKNPKEHLAACNDMKMKPDWAKDLVNRKASELLKHFS